MAIPLYQYEDRSSEYLFRKRSNSMFKPIQAHTVHYNDGMYGRNIKSDWLNYSLGFINFIVDCALEVMHVINFLISVTNVLISLAAMAINRCLSDSDAFDNNVYDLELAGKATLYSALALLNPIISLISYITRPIASIVECCSGKNEEEQASTFVYS